MRAVLLIVILSSLASAQNVPQWVVPSFRDLKIKTRTVRGLMDPQVSTWYFKGARERSESSPNWAKPGFMPITVSIVECDQRAIVRLRPHSQTYSIFAVPESTNRKMITHRSRPVADGPEVAVTIDSVDTGERKQIGSYQARHLKTTVVVQPSKGAATKPGKVEADTWYLEIPGLGCDHDIWPFAWMRLYEPLLSHEYSEHRDHIEIEKNAAEPGGLVIEESIQELSDGNRIMNKTELVEVSTEPLDQSWFEIPPDFRQVEPGHTLKPIHPEINLVK